MESTPLTITRMRDEVLHGLTKSYKSLPCKYLYDEKGSLLFDRISELDEYYPTRTELKIMEDNLDEILRSIPQKSLLVEMGSGSSLKTRMLLENHPELAGYVPVDISEEVLMDTTDQLRGRYPHIPIIPVVADYTHPFDISGLEIPHEHTVVYFPGSTIGNFLPTQAEKFLTQIAGICEDNGGLLIGVDLKKDTNTLEAAYNDSEGITAAFNKNILSRINQELDADFNTDYFKHEAVYDKTLGRVEMHLVSTRDQIVHLGETEIRFNKGESIHTENSYKYDVAVFSEMAEKAGFEIQKVWTDEKRFFSVMYFNVGSR